VPLGCVVAGRLAYADPNLKVMLIEGRLVHIQDPSSLILYTGGANNRDDPWVYRYGGLLPELRRYS
jgi:alcohol oxidase